MDGFNQIAKKYEDFPNERIIKIANEECRGLRNEVVSLLIDEIQKRGLDSDMISWIQAERTILSNERINSLLAYIKNFSCPRCNTTQTKLIGISYTTVTSFGLGCNFERNEDIVCLKCSRYLLKKSTISSLLLGWWSPEGLFGTPVVLINKLFKLFCHIKDSKKILLSFIDINRGTLVLNDFSKKIISQLLKDKYYSQRPHETNENL